MYACKIVCMQDCPTVSQQVVIVATVFVVTFSHLADAFIQSDVQRREQSS